MVSARPFPDRNKKSTVVTWSKRHHQFQSMGARCQKNRVARFPVFLMQQYVLGQSTRQSQRFFFFAFFGALCDGIHVRVVGVVWFGAIADLATTCAA